MLLAPILRWFVISAGLLALAQPCAAQAGGMLPLQNYSRRQGLRNLAIQNLAQDPGGLLWVNTQAGTFQFDGTEFRRPPVAGAPHAFKATLLATLADGSVWMGTLDRLYRWDGSIFQPCRFPAGQPVPVIRGICPGPGGLLMAGTSAGLYACGASGALTPVQGSPSGPCGAVARDPRTGTTWTVTAQGLQAVPDQGAPPAPQALPLRTDPAACALLTDSSGRIWVRTPDGAALRESDGRVRDVTGGPLPTNPDRIFLGELPDGRIWTSTSSGPSAWDGHRWESILPMTGLAHYRLNATLVDQEGSLWLGSAGTLSRSLGGGSWMTYLQASGLAHPAVFQIKRTRSGALWVGTEDGAARREGLDWKPSAATRGRRIISLAEAPDGTLWCGDNYGRITVITGTGELQRVYGAQDGLRGTGTRSILWDREGRPWLGHIHGGITRGVQTGGRWRFEPVDLPGGTPDEDIRVIRQGAGDELLIASSQGLVRRSGSTWRRFGTQDGLRDRTIMDLAHMPDGRYAICYFQPLGLDLFRFNEGSLALDAHYEEGGSLGSSKIYSLALDDRNRLWMGTGAGVAMLEGGKLQSFTEEEGLVHDDCMQGALLSEAQGVMWVGTAGGLSRYAPPLAPAALPRPRTLVRGMKVEDGPRSLASGGLRLGAKERSLTLALTGLTYRYDRLRQVEVRMDGLESNWSQMEGGEARYPYLPPGAYTFRARSRIAGGEWGPELTVPIRVVPAWWQHAAFRAALALAALMAVGLGVNLRLRGLKARNAELDQRVRRAVDEIRTQNGELVRLNEAKNRVLAAAAHDVRNPLGAIILYLDLLEEEPDQREHTIPKMRRITHETLDLLNSLLEFSRVEAGSLAVELAAVDPEEVVAQVMETEAPVAERKGLRLHVERREEVTHILADRLRLKEILNNLVDNAIKFSATIPPGREIRLILGRGWIAVQDQGPGFSEEDLAKVFSPFTRLSARPTAGESSTGLGLSIVKGMVEAMGGTLGLESVQGQGATFTVRLPPA